MTEGNYLLLEASPWPLVRAQLDAVWHVVTDDALRLPRLVARHVASGKTPAEAAAWVDPRHRPNGVLIEAARTRADLPDLTDWNPDLSLVHRGSTPCSTTVAPCCVNKRRVRGGVPRRTPPA